MRIPKDTIKSTKPTTITPNVVKVATKLKLKTLIT